MLQNIIKTMKKELTVIIPFLNEGIEVYNTLKSIRETSQNKVDIILINDCSSDSFDYKQLVCDFDTEYIEHQERKGVAYSRDEGISVCQTDYFLLLDAHMRVYQHDWVELLLRELKKNDKCILCCKTLSLDEFGEIESSLINEHGHGAFFQFNNLNISWIPKERSPNHTSEEIPCVLGASYAASKRYWQHLRGLSGLLFYGLDEQLISMKAWLEGGKCAVIKSVVFGHIFRKSEKVPYTTKTKEFFYNKLYIVELFFQGKNKIELLRNIKKEAGRDFFNEIISHFETSRNNIFEEKEYYKKHFKNDISYLVYLNEEIVKTMKK